MTDFLHDMAVMSRQRVDVATGAMPAVELLARIKDLAAPPSLRLGGGFDLIAEVKLRSPAVGLLQSTTSTPATDRVVAYAGAGVAAVSVLTEPTRFDGSMSDLTTAADALTPLAVPAMRKDFLVDPYQVLEARASGAGGVLVILRMLPRAILEQLIDTALEHGLFVLLEAFDEADIELAEILVTAQASSRHKLLVGVNCRDLVSLQVVPGRLELLAPRLPSSVLRVAESGVATPQDAARMAAVGYQLALVGSALMVHRDPAILIGAMLTAARRALA
ncbi:MAG: indole-3-glycerol-phosphate synthase [Pseudomonadales bacterium]|nr:indole-3-glycerol-phosphate synthase [Pseudomonadales bacterium]